MVPQTYDEAMRRVLADEGGYSNDAADPGGPTKYGITIFDVRKYLKANATAADVRALTVADAMAIYRKHYANPSRYDDLPAGVDYAILDYGINSGIGRSGKVLRALVGLPSNTSVIDAEVITAVAKRDPKVLNAAIWDERLAFLRRLKTWPVFGKGWGRRVANGKLASASMASRTPGKLPPEIGSAGSVGKGVVPPPVAATHAVTKAVPAAALVTGGTFWDWVSTHQAFSALIAAAIVCAIVMAVRALKARHTAKQETPPADLQPVPEMVPAPV